MSLIMLRHRALNTLAGMCFIAPSRSFKVIFQPFELHFMLLKNFDRTNLLQFSTQINLSAPILHRIVCSVDTDKTFRFESHCGYRVGSFGRNKKPMIGVGWESGVGDNARGKTNRVAFVAVCVFFAPNSFVWSLGPMLWERRKES